MDMNKIVSNCDIGVAIRKRRHELSLSQEALASKLNVSTQQVHRYESDKDNISVERLQAVAHALSVPVSYFICQSRVVEPIHENSCERELLSHFRKIQAMGSKELVVDLARSVAKWEDIRSVQ